MYRFHVALFAALGALSSFGAGAKDPIPPGESLSTPDIITDKPTDMPPSDLHDSPSDVLNKTPDLSILDKKIPILETESRYRQIGGIQSTQRRLGDSGLTFLKK